MIKFDIKLGWVTNTITSADVGGGLPEISSTTTLAVPNEGNSAVKTLEASYYPDFLKRFWSSSDTDNAEVIKKLEERLNKLELEKDKTKTEMDQLKQQIDHLSEELQLEKKKVVELQACIEIPHKN